MSGHRRGIVFDRGDLRGASFRNVDLRGVRMRGVELGDADLDGDVDGLRIHGVEVAPLIGAELDRRHPERAVMRATDPADLQSGWVGLEAMWDATVARVEAMEPGTEHVSVDGEWSLAQTLRHLVFATDVWLGATILGRERPFHPIGQLFSEIAGRETQFGLDPDADPSLAEIVAVRAGRRAMVRDYLADVTPEQLAETRDDPWGPGRKPTVLQCLRVIFNEEWHHHRYATRDLDAIELGLGHEKPTA